MRLSAFSKVLIWVSVAAITSGFAYAHCKRMAEEDAKYETKTIIHRVVVQDGDTFEGIIGRYYSDDMKPWEPWDSWKTKQRKLNENLFHYNDGSHRWLQPNDAVYIKQEVRVKR